MTTVKSIEEIKNLMGRIDPIQGRPTFTTIRHLEKQLIAGAKRIQYRACKYGHAGDIMEQDPYKLLSTVPWPEPTDPGAYLKLDGAITSEPLIRIEEQKWKAEDIVFRTFMNFRIAMRQSLEGCIDTPYQSGATDFSDEGFGSDTPKQIIFNLKQQYGDPRVEEISANMRRLLEPFDRSRTIEELIREIEDIQMFLMSIPSGDRKLPEITLIDHALMKLQGTNLYSKAIERWQSVTSKTWLEFKTHFKKEYARMLKEGGGNTMQNEGYGTAFNTIEDDTSLISITEGLTNYAEKQSATETTVTNLTDHAAFLTHRLEAQEKQIHMLMAAQSNQPPPQMMQQYQPTAPPAAAYYAPIQQPMDIANQANKRFAPSAPQVMQTQIRAPPQMTYPTQNPFQQPYQQPQRQPQYQQTYQRPGRQGRGRGTRGRRQGGRGRSQQNQWQPQSTQGWNQGQQPTTSWNQGQQTQQQDYQGGQNLRGRTPYSNTTKVFDNILYCFSCGYDVDHAGCACPNPRWNHIPNIPRNKAHEVQGACMKAQHKTLQDGTGAGIGWILSQNIRKAEWGQQTTFQN